MDAKAIDICGELPPLDLGDYSFIEICDLKIEVRDGKLSIRNPYGRLVVRPIVTNTIEVEGE